MFSHGPSPQNGGLLNRDPANWSPELEVEIELFPDLSNGNWIQDDSGNWSLFKGNLPQPDYGNWTLFNGNRSQEDYGNLSMFNSNRAQPDYGNWSQLLGNLSKEDYGDLSRNEYDNWSEFHANWSQVDYGNWSQADYGNWSELYGNWSQADYGNGMVAQPNISKSWLDLGVQLLLGFVNPTGKNATTATATLAAAIEQGNQEARTIPAKP
jgi:hypothetical protein